MVLKDCFFMRKYICFEVKVEKRAIKTKEVFFSVSIFWLLEKKYNIWNSHQNTVFIMNINIALDKAYEGKSFKELVGAPVAALAGISDKDAELLKSAFGVKTVGDLAKLKYVAWAQAIVTLAETEE